MDIEETEKKINDLYKKIGVEVPYPKHEVDPMEDIKTRLKEEFWDVRISTLRQCREEIEKKKAKPYSYQDENGYQPDYLTPQESAYNQALDDILQALNRLEQKHD